MQTQRPCRPADLLLAVSPVEDAALAWLGFARRSRYDVLFSNGENVPTSRWRYS